MNYIYSLSRKLEIKIQKIIQHHKTKKLPKNKKEPQHYKIDLKQLN